MHKDNLEIVAKLGAVCHNNNNTENPLGQILIFRLCRQQQQQQQLEQLEQQLEQEEWQS